MALEAGAKLGHYEIVSSLGAGGMGEVYRAKDTKLGGEARWGPWSPQHESCRGRGNKGADMTPRVREPLFALTLGITALLVATAPLAAAEVTYTEDVAPIFVDRCGSCHRPDGMAPMSLLSFESARPWARAIQREVTSRRMPPFHARGSDFAMKHDGTVNLELLGRSVPRSMVDFEFSRRTSPVARHRRNDLAASGGWVS